MQALYKQSIISAKNFNGHTLESLFKDAKFIQEQSAKGVQLDYLKGKTITLLFCEPSTRTQNSFHAAAAKLGATVINVDINNSSMKKSETLQDTLKTLEQISDAVVMRHPEQNIHANMLQFLKKPLINAGDGSGEHPTQAIQDAFTIWNQFKYLDGLNITLMGDLKHGRTVHSLVQVLNNFQNITLNTVAPLGFEFPSQYFRKHQKYSVQPTLTEKVLRETDVLYVTRLQRERFAIAEEFKNIASGYHVNLDQVEKMKKTAIVMHPFPRVDELDVNIDNNHRAKYFTQIENGVYMRAALLWNVLTDRHNTETNKPIPSIN